MLPRAFRPARSTRRGSRPNTEGGIAARRGRLAGGQADLALGHGEARERIHHQQHVAALVAKVLGDRRGGQRRLDAHQRRLVAGGHDHHAAGQACRTEVALAGTR